jgi:hypothetical protein
MDRMGNLGFFIFIFAIGCIPAVFYIKSIQDTLKLIDIKNRKIETKYNWLTLIPIPVFANIWSFIMVTLVANSIESEYKERGIAYKTKPTFITGLVMSIASCLAYFPPFKKYTAVLCMVFFLAYWAQIVQSKRNLTETQPEKV